MSRRAAEAGGRAREDVLARCKELPQAELDYPFGDDVAVFKVAGKIFAIVSLYDGPPVATLKCEPEESEALRQAHPAIVPGYHMNKKHWITVDLAADLPTDLVPELVQGSYDLVVASIPAKRRPPTAT